MSSVDTFLLAIAGILALGSLGGYLFAHSGIPDALWLVAAGIVLGPVLGLFDPSTLSAMAPYFGAITIIVVLFEGGSRLRIGGMLRNSPRALALALLGFAFSSALVAVAVVLAGAAGLVPSAWTLPYALLIGAILGGSSSVVVMPAVLQMHVPDAVRDMVALESALTDILCVVAATSILAIMVASGHATADPAVAIAGTFVVGLIAGVGAGIGSLPFARAIRPSPYAYPVLLAALLVLYVAVDANRGSAPLAVLVFALLIGNIGFRVPADEAHMVGSLDEATRSIHSQITFIVKAFFFTFMGVLVGHPSVLAAVGVGLGLLLLVARAAAVRVALVGSGVVGRDRRIVSILLPRGLAAGVLATLPATAGLAAADPIADLVYPAVVTTIVLFAIAMPFAQRGAPEAVVLAEDGLEADDAAAATEPIADTAPT
jgi:cell volume regulation protein A